MKGLAGRGDTLKAADLGPHARVVQEIEHELERLLIEPVLRDDAAHVVDDERDVETEQEVAVRENVLGIEMHLQMPAERLDARDDRFDHLEIRGTAKMRDEV